ncbi:MAG: anthranilate synthase component I family protein [Salinibacterium sp.]|nr:MAG: anthranilate synthase component I family protein [Salinibacterium sp.]
MRQRVQTASLGRWVDPAVAYAALCGDDDGAFWLDSGPGAVSGMSYLGRASRIVSEFEAGVLPWLRAALAAADIDTSDAPAGFALGWVGWLGYEVRGETMGVPVRESRYPLAAFLSVERALAFDHAAQTVTLLALADVEGYREEVLAALAVAAPLPVASAGPGEVSWRYTDEQYLSMIADCQTAIDAGDAYQLCLTTEVSVSSRPSPLGTYLALRGASPTHHGALLRASGVSVLSASPERFLAVSPEGVVTTSPIKGTRPRGVTADDDAALRAELESSEKEQAENLMIVDLMRNDIARVAKLGTVAVTSLLAVESYAQVHQLVSTVQGELADALTAVDAIEACFPAGSMTGAPKLSATQILDRIEQRARGIYSGAFGYLGFDGAMDLAMVIRTIIIDAEGTTIGTGGGITALSVPAEELAEARLKAEVLLRVLGADRK